MIKKQLLLLSLILNIVAMASSPAGLVNNGAQNVVNLYKISTPQTVLDLVTTPTATPGGPPPSDQSRTDQPLNKIEVVTSTPTVTQPPEKKNPLPTRPPRPTGTPIPIPPAANPNATSLMILFGLIAVIVVIVGVWLNRPHR